MVTFALQYYVREIISLLLLFLLYIFFTFCFLLFYWDYHLIQRITIRIIKTWLIYFVLLRYKLIVNPLCFLYLSSRKSWTDVILKFRQFTLNRAKWSCLLHSDGFFHVIIINDGDLLFVSCLWCLSCILSLVEPVHDFTVLQKVGAY